MNEINIHERELNAPVRDVGELIDSLSSRADRLWPTRFWPRMQLDRPLGVGARGGHGPIRYEVEAYNPGRSVRFRFTGPAGFDGFHELEIAGETGESVILRHSLRMRTRGLAILTWPLLFRPLHDALIEDAFATAEAALKLEPRIKPWSIWVRMVRAVTSGGRAPAQKFAVVAGNRAV